MAYSEKYTNNGYYFNNDGISPGLADASDSRPRIWSSRKQLFTLLKIEAALHKDDQSTDFQHIKFKANQKICTSGDSFNNLFVVYSGFLKTSWADVNGNEKILNFPMRGDVIGLDGIGKNEYQNDVVAISDVELIIIPNKKSGQIEVGDNLLQDRLLQILCNELIRAQKIEYIIGCLPAEARVAKFLLSLGQKYHQLGFSEKSFNLRMTRNDIGSYLGLTLETVSRTLSEFNKVGLVTVDQKSICINDTESLKKLRRITPVRSKKLLSN